MLMGMMLLHGSRVHDVPARTEARPITITCAAIPMAEAAPCYEAYDHECLPAASCTWIGKRAVTVADVICDMAMVFGVRHYVKKRRRG